MLSHDGHLTLDAMRLELPTKKQLIGFFKYGILVSIPVLVVAAWFVYKDLVRLSAEQYLLKSQNIAEAVGTVNSVSLAKATYVQAAISYSGVHTPAYNLYRYKVSGTKATGIATVRVEEPGTSNEVFSVSFEQW